MIQYQYTIVGEGLKAKDLKAFLNKSYDKNLNDHGHYKIDKKLSGQRVQVYHTHKKSFFQFSHVFL